MKANRKALPASILNALLLDTRTGPQPIMTPFEAFGAVAGFGADAPEGCPLTPPIAALLNPKPDAPS
jgi:hypothetical protein